MLTLQIVRRFCAASTFTSAKNAVLCNGRNNVLKNSRNLLNVDQPVLFKLKKERDPEKLFNLFKLNANNKVLVENRFAFEDTVGRLAGAGRFDYIECLLEQQKALPQGRREGFVIRIIMLYGKAGMMRHALNTFFDMHLYGCRRTVKSFNATLMILTKSRDINMIESFLRDVPMRFEIAIDLMSLNIVVNTFCEMLILDKAYMLMVEAEKSGLCPDVVTYTILISAFYKARRWEFANGLWNLMVLKGCPPNLATFNVRIQFLANIGRAWEANELLALMHTAKVIPDEITYNLVIKAFFLARRPDMVERVCSDFYRRGYKPNEKIYQTIIHYLCKSGDYDLAFTKCQESMKCNHFPSLHSIYMLLQGLWKNNRRDKAIYIMTLVRKRVPPYKKDQLQAMQSILSYG
ncbi:hypothetical protein LIER_19982 [Lithospermum erythrorhizon]|uniref:Pentatricopeptide repeat-containing protein n=1 Tax=Lithospermum erythrorhizon TaxID=34254 RepID=A0AAV3QMT5_LITER